MINIASYAVVVHMDPPLSCWDPYKTLIVAGVAGVATVEPPVRWQPVVAGGALPPTSRRRWWTCGATSGRLCFVSIQSLAQVARGPSEMLYRDDAGGRQNPIVVYNNTAGKGF